MQPNGIVGKTTGASTVIRATAAPMAENGGNLTRLASS